MKSIRGKVIQVFISITAVLFFSNVVFGVMHFYVIGLYQKDVAKLSDDYHLLEYSGGIINSFNVLFKDPQNQSALNEYNTFRSQLQATIQNEDALGQNEVSYVGLKNTVLAVLENTDQSVAFAKSGDISQETNYYNAAKSAYGFVKENSTNLFVDDLKILASTQSQVDSLSNLSSYVGIVFVVFIFISCLIFALFFARKIVRPLEKLTVLTEQIAANNLDVKISQDLFDSKDELSRLAGSFSIMAQNLKDNIAKINRSNTELVAATAAMQEKTDELERVNKFMINRELRMRELKEKITELEERLGNRASAS